MAWSKQKRAEYMKKYREENRDKITFNRRYYYDMHKEKERAQSKQWYENNKDNPKLKERRKENFKKWKENNINKFNEYQRKYQLERRKNDSTGTFKKSKCDRKESVSTCKETRQIANS